MARRLRLVSLCVAAALVAATAALVVWRVSVAQSLLDWAAKAFDIPSARITVERITADRARAIDLAAGERAELTVDAIEVAYGPLALAKGRVDEIVVEGLTLTLDLRQDASPLGSLQPLLERLGAEEPGAAEPKGLPEHLPDVRFRAGRLAAETPYGPAGIAFDGALDSDPEAGPRLRLQAELTSDMARLLADLSASGNPQEHAEAAIVISEGRVELPDGLLRIEDLEGDLNVGVEAGRPSAGQGTLEARGLAVAGTRFDEARTTFDLSPERADLTARLASDDGSFALALEARAERLDAMPKLSLELSAEIGRAAPIWAFGRPPLPVGGEGRLQLSAQGEFPALPPLPADGGTIGDWLAQGGLSGRVAGDFARLALPDSAAEAAVDADVAAVWANNELSLSTRQDSRVAVTGLAAADLVRFGLPAGLADRLVGALGDAVSLVLPAPGQEPSVIIWRPDEPARGARFDGSAEITAGPLTAAVTGTAEAALGPAPALTRADLSEVSLAATGIELDGLAVEDLTVTGDFAGDPRIFQAAGDLRGRLAIGDLNGLSADRLSLDLPLRVARDARVFDLSLTGSGRLTAEGLAADGLLRAEAPVEVALAAHKARLTLAAENGGFAVDHETRLGLGETSLRLQSERGPGIPLKLRAPDVRLTGELSEDGGYRGETVVRDAAVTLTDFELAFAAISADLALAGPTNAAADFEIAALRHLASPAAFKPLSVSGRADRRGETVDLNALVRRPDGEPLAMVTAAHDLASGSGQAELRLEPLRFSPGGLQPAALSPLLADLSQARGTAEGAATVSWTGDGLTGGATVSIEDLTFTGKDLAVAGLDLELILDSLQPPASPPGQLLRADVIDPGVPLKDLEVRFRLPPDAPGKILIEDASFATVGSRFALHDTLLDPAGERLETLLRVDEMDVAVLFDLLAVDGLSGSGELSGSIPIRRDGDVVTIPDARLEARGPGALRFRSDAARRALAGGGEYVDLVIRALEDFRYETLVLTGKLDRDGETTMRLEILGQNPEVLEGHPFQLNINLTGNSSQILEAMLLGRALIEEIMARARTLSQ